MIFILIRVYKKTYSWRLSWSTSGCQTGTFVSSCDTRESRISWKHRRRYKGKLVCFRSVVNVNLVCNCLEYSNIVNISHFQYNLYGSDDIKKLAYKVIQFVKLFSFTIHDGLSFYCHSSGLKQRLFWSKLFQRKLDL